MRVVVRSDIGAQALGQRDCAYLLWAAVSSSSWFLKIIIHPICNVRGVSREPSHAGSLDALQVYLLFVNISFSHLNKPVILKKFENLTTERVKVEEDTGKLRNEINKRLLTRKDVNDRVVHMCTVCNKEGSKKDKMRNHIEIHLEGFSYKCKYCDVVKKTTASIKFHEWHYHTRGSDTIQEPEISHE